MSSSVNRLEEFDRVEYDPTTETYHNLYRWEDSNSLCLTIVETVSVANGRETTAMESLYSVLDPEALESLLATTRDGDVRVSFTFEGCTVRVTGSGEVVVDPEN